MAHLLREVATATAHVTHTPQPLYMKERAETSGFQFRQVTANWFQNSRERRKENASVLFPSQALSQMTATKRGCVAIHALVLHHHPAGPAVTPQFRSSPSASITACMHAGSHSGCLCALHPSASMLQARSQSFCCRTSQSRAARLVSGPGAATALAKTAQRGPATCTTIGGLVSKNLGGGLI